MPVIILIALSLLTGKIAKDKGREFGIWFVYGFMLLIIALPHAIMMSSKGKECPVCGYTEKFSSKKCTNCYYEFEIVRPVGPKSLEPEYAFSLTELSNRIDKDNQQKISVEAKELIYRFCSNSGKDYTLDYVVGTNEYEEYYNLKHYNESNDINFESIEKLREKWPVFNLPNDNILIRKPIL